MCVFWEIFVMTFRSLVELVQFLFAQNFGMTVEVALLGLAGERQFESPISFFSLLLFPAMCLRYDVGTTRLKFEWLLDYRPYVFSSRRVLYLGPARHF